MRTSTSSSSLTLRSCSIARRRVFMSWLPTAARPVSSSPESTRSVRSSSSVFTWGSSLLALPLPPFDAARRRFSAFLGSCQKQYSCGGSTVTVHLPPSRFIPAHVAVKYAPPPYPLEVARWELAPPNKAAAVAGSALPPPSVVILCRPPQPDAKPR